MEVLLNCSKLVAGCTVVWMPDHEDVQDWPSCDGFLLFPVNVGGQK